LATLKTKGYRGVNVTVPHKQAVMAHLDEISAEAQAVGAVNTILVRGDLLAGHNTDCDGFLSALLEGGLQPAGKHALVLGAGGGARSVVYALVREGATVAIHNRTAQRARDLAHDMQCAASQASIVTDLGDLDLDRFDLLVNTTSLGMWPRTAASPWPESLSMPPHWTVFDLVYNPIDTRLLVQARSMGAATIGGLGMLVHQGALAFEMWTGQVPSLHVMRLAAERALGD
jgi:shikimate dehydrogenase